MLLLPLRSNCGLFLSSLFSVLFSRSFLYSCSWRILHLVQFQSCTRKLIHSAVLTVHHCFGLCLQRTERRSAASALPKLRISAQSAALPLQRLSSKCVSTHRAPLCRFNDFQLASQRKGISALSLQLLLIPNNRDSPTCVSAHKGISALSLQRLLNPNRLSNGLTSISALPLQRLLPPIPDSRDSTIIISNGKRCKLAATLAD